MPGSMPIFLYCFCQCRCGMGLSWYLFIWYCAFKSTVTVENVWVKSGLSVPRLMQFIQRCVTNAPMLFSQQQNLTLLVLKLEYPTRNRSVPFLLMHWLLASPAHQQPQYWQYLWRINESCSSTDRRSSAPCTISVQSDRKWKHIS